MNLGNVFWACVMRWRYRRHVRRLRGIFGTRPVKVGFFVSELAKWKGQTVYETMAGTDKFDPVILVVPTSRETAAGPEAELRAVQDKVRYFTDRGMKVETPVAKDPGCDVIFYQQPYEIGSKYRPKKLSKYALTFYFPYFTPNMATLELDVGMKLHHGVFRYIVQNEWIADYYRKHTNRLEYAGDFVGLGHPALDVFYENRDYRAKENYVIFAPHWTFPRKGVELNCNFSTFLDTGRVVLDFAKAHPEIKWVFKPHPLLKPELISTGVWSKDEVDEYWADWERIGQSCYTPDYQRLFLEARAMITDCGSFVTEFACTGKPLIRMRSKLDKQLPHPVVGELYGTLYETWSIDELESDLDSVVIRGDDVVKDRRIAAVRKAGLATECAAPVIVELVERVCRGEDR